MAYAHYYQHFCYKTKEARSLDSKQEGLATPAYRLCSVHFMVGVAINIAAVIDFCVLT